MTIEDIKTYLEDTTDLSDEVIKDITPQILRKLDYEYIYAQVDVLAHQLTKTHD